MLFNTNHATSIGPEAWQCVVVKPVLGDEWLLNTHQACVGRWSMDRWPLIDGEKFSIAPPMAVEYHTTSPGALHEATINELMEGWLLNPLRGCIGRWSMDRWPLVAGRLWMLSAWHCVVVQPHHGCIERWSVEQWSLIDARLLGDGRFLNLRRKPSPV